MGQAKNRGSFEKRKAESIIRDTTSLGGGIGQAISPVDPDNYLHLFKLGTQAGLSVATGKSITVDSLNEALHAAIKELGKMQVNDKEAYLARLACLRSIFDSGRFDSHFQRTEEGHVFVEHVLLKAMAVSPCTTHWNELMQSAFAAFDLDELAKMIVTLGN